MYSTILDAQAYLDWGTLADVEFESEYSEEFGIEILIAKFGAYVKNFDGQEVSLTGYMIPLDPLGTTYVLSRNPNASCFFCGGAGPETVVQLQLSPHAIRRYRTDEYLTFKGTLQLHERNEKKFNYVLKKAEPM
jgi:hypothetical protein